MIVFWLGFFAFVALLLVLDLGVLHRDAKAPTIASATAWTAGWIALGLAFTVVVYLIYQNNWMGAHLVGCPPGHADGTNAALTYVSAYLLEQALSVDNIFVIALVFANFGVPLKYQHRVLFWGILGAIVFRVVLLGGGAYVAARLDWIFYAFGAYLAWKGLQLLRGGGDDDAPERIIRFVRRFVPVADGDHGGTFAIRSPSGRRMLTTVAICLVVVELTDVLFAFDSIPAVLSVSRETFVMVTSNVFAILGLRSLYFVLAAALMRFKYLELALGVLLVVIGAKMIAHDVFPVSHVVTLVVIASILAVGIGASLVAGKREASEPGPASRSP